MGKTSSPAAGAASIPVVVAVVDTLAAADADEFLTRRRPGQHGPGPLAWRQPAT